jgi:hypothetical protein
MTAYMEAKSNNRFICNIDVTQSLYWAFYVNDFLSLAFNVHV